MQNHTPSKQKSSIQKQTFTDQNRDFDERFDSSKSKKATNAHHEDKSKVKGKESYNGGSTYREHS